MSNYRNTDEWEDITQEYLSTLKQTTGGDEWEDITAEYLSRYGRESQPSGLFERAVKDPLVSLAKGATVGLGEAAVGLADIPTMGYAGKGVDYALKSTLGGGLQEAGEWFDEQLTPEAREAQRKVAEAKGFIPTVQTAIENPSSIVSTIMESAPSMIGGAGIGRAALWAVGKKVLGSKALQEAVKGLSKEVADKLIEQNIKRAITAGAVGEGLVTAGQNIEATRQQTETGTLTPGQVGINLASGALTGTISRLSGGLAKRLGITDLDTLLQGVNTGAQRAGVVAKLKGAIGSAITEGAFEELPQSAQEQMAQNIALGKPIFEGVPEAGAMGLLAGAGMGLMGAGGGMAINRHPAKGGQVKPPTQPPPSEPPGEPPPSGNVPPGGPTFNGFEDFAGAYQDGATYDDLKGKRDEYSKRPDADPNVLSDVDTFLGEIKPPVDGKIEELKSIHEANGITDDELISQAGKLIAEYPNETDKIKAAFPNVPVTLTDALKKSESVTPFTDESDALNKSIIENLPALKANEGVIDNGLRKETKTEVKAPVKAEPVKDIAKPEPVKLEGTNEDFKRLQGEWKQEALDGKITEEELGRRIVNFKVTEPAQAKSARNDGIAKILDDLDNTDLQMSDAVTQLKDMDISDPLKVAIADYEKAVKVDKTEYGMRSGLPEDAEANLRAVMERETQPAPLSKPPEDSISGKVEASGNVKPAPKAEGKATAKTHTPGIAVADADAVPKPTTIKGFVGEHAHNGVGFIIQKVKHGYRAYNYDKNPIMTKEFKTAQEAITEAQRAIDAQATPKPTPKVEAKPTSAQNVTHRYHRPFLKGMEDGAMMFALAKKGEVVSARHMAIKAGLNQAKEIDAFVNGFELAYNEKYTGLWKEQKNLLNQAIRNGDVVADGWKFENGVATETEKAPEPKAEGKATKPKRRIFTAKPDNTKMREALSITTDEDTLNLVLSEMMSDLQSGEKGGMIGKDADGEAIYAKSGHAQWYQDLAKQLEKENKQAKKDGYSEIPINKNYFINVIDKGLKGSKLTNTQNLAWERLNQIANREANGHYAPLVNEYTGFKEAENARIKEGVKQFQEGELTDAFAGEGEEFIKGIAVSENTVAEELTESERAFAERDAEDVIESIKTEGKVTPKGKFETGELDGFGYKDTWDLTNPETDMSKHRKLSEQKPTKDEEIPFQRGKSQGLQQFKVQTVINKALGAIPNAPKVNVVQSNKDCPAEVQKIMEQEGIDDAMGFTYKGEVYLVADNLRSPEEALRTLAHELTHSGLGKFFQRQTKGKVMTVRVRYEALMDSIYRAHSKEIEKLAKTTHTHLNMRTVQGRRQASEEWLCNQTYEAQPKWYDKLVAIFHDLLRAIGLDVKLSDAEVRVVLQDAFKEFGGEGISFRIAHHGTPHILQPEPGFPHGRFRLEYIGTGEGVAAYGYGIYSGEAEATGREYRDNLSGRMRASDTTIASRYESKFNNEEAFDDHEIKIAKVAKEIQGDPAERIWEFSDGSRVHVDVNQMDFVASQTGGSLYKLDIPDDVIPKLLDWDKPLSEQSEYVKKALEKALLKIDEKTRKRILDNQDKSSGAYIYGQLTVDLGSPKAASEYLASIGIPGNKYLDQMSRGKGEGSYNFVIWHQPTLDRIALLERNGEKLDAIREAQSKSAEPEAKFERRGLKDTPKSANTESVTKDKGTGITAKDNPTPEAGKYSDPDKIIARPIKSVGIQYGDELPENVYLHGSRRAEGDIDNFSVSTSPGGTLYLTKKWETAEIFSHNVDKNESFIKAVELNPNADIIDLSKDADRKRLADLLYDESDKYEFTKEKFADDFKNMDFHEAGLSDDLKYGEILYDENIGAIKDNFGNIDVINDYAIKTYNPKSLPNPTRPPEVGGQDVKFERREKEAVDEASEPTPPEYDLGDLESKRKDINDFVNRVRRSLEFPEMVMLARDLLGGKFPIVMAKLRSAFGNSALGKFIPQGEGNILLKAGIFSDIQTASKVLAHEIGHLVDFLPNHLMTRGNILGRIASLHKYMKHFLGEYYNAPEGTNVNGYKRDDIMKELKNLTKLWSPFDDSVNSSYRKYRWSSKELYADAFSVFINDPELMQKEAPTFYKAFLSWIESKPEVKETYDAYQKLAFDREAVQERREKYIYEMQKGHKTKEQEVMEQIEAERKISPRSILRELYRGLIDRNIGMMDAIKKLQKAGKISSANALKYFKEERNYLAAEADFYLEEVKNKILDPLKNAGFTEDDIGYLGTLMRTATQRRDVANPGGMGGYFSDEQIEHLKTKLGTERFNTLKGLLEKFSDLRQELVIPKLEEAGMYSEALLNTMKTQKNYLTFNVTKFMDKMYGPMAMNAFGKVYHTVGTFQDIQNPFIATIFKDISLMRAAEITKYKKELHKTFSENEELQDQIQPAEKKFNGTAQVFVEPKDPKMGMISYLKNGKVEAFYITKEIADDFNYNSIEAMHILKFFNALMMPVKALLVNRNPIWMFRNVVRDYLGTAQNIPGATVTNLLPYYRKAFMDAWGEVMQGKKLDVVQAMKKGKMLVIDRQYHLSDDMSDDTEFDKLYAKFGHYGEAKRKGVIEPLMKAWDFLGDLGKVSERAGKIAGYRWMKENTNMTEREIGHVVRSRIGTPDVYRRGAWQLVTNNLFLYSNVGKEGFRSSWESFQDDKAAYTWKLVKYNIMPKAVLALAALGAFGDDAEDIIKRISNYDKANYLVVPFNKTADGRAVYLRMPQSYTGQVLGAIMWDILNLEFKKATESVASMQPYSFNPLVKAVLNWGLYAMDTNPQDWYRGQNIVNRKEWDAGEPYRLIEMSKNTWNSLGGGLLYKFNKGQDPKGVWEQISSLPGLNILGSFLKESNQGLKEEYAKASQKAKQASALKSLDKDEAVAKRERNKRKISEAKSLLRKGFINYDTYKEAVERYQ